jgi:hypothetical protein
MDARPSWARPFAPARTGLAQGGSPCRVRVPKPIGGHRRATLRVRTAQPRPTRAPRAPRPSPADSRRLHIHPPGPQHPPPTAGSRRAHSPGPQRRTQPPRSHPPPAVASARTRGARSTQNHRRPAPPAHTRSITLTADRRRPHTPAARPPPAAAGHGQRPAPRTPAHRRNPTHTVGPVAPNHRRQPPPAHACNVTATAGSRSTRPPLPRPQSHRPPAQPRTHPPGPAASTTTADRPQPAHARSITPTAGGRWTQPPPPRPHTHRRPEPPRTHPPGPRGVPADGGHRRAPADLGIVASHSGHFADISPRSARDRGRGGG